MLLSEQKLSFYQGTDEVAYFSNNKLYVTDAEILERLQLGKFAFIPRSNGNLSFRYLGGQVINRLEVKIYGFKRKRDNWRIFTAQCHAELDGNPDIANNKSTIKWTLKGSGSYSGWVRVSEVRIKIDGSQVFYRDSSHHTDAYNGTQICSGSKTLNHNADGSKSFFHLC